MNRDMAYKNKNKQKKHVASLKNIGWRKSNAKQKALNRQRNAMSHLGLGQSEIEKLMKMQGMI